MDLIITHKSCPDGWCAAFIAHKKYPEAEILPLDHGTEPPYEKVRGKDVLVLDFSWRTREQNVQMMSVAKSFRILDHHKTAQATLDGLPFATFDMKRSGAGLAWDYLFGIDSNWYDNGFDAYTTRPWYVNYTEDRDLWNWALPESHEINAYLMTLPFTIEAYSKLDFKCADDAAELGRGALAQVEHYVEKAVEQHQKGIFQGHSAAIVNALYTNISEVGNELAKLADVGIGYFERADGMMQFSLRSIGDTDVSAMAQVFGGGGHRNAAGFQVNVAHGRYLVDTILGRPANVSYAQAIY